MAIINGRQIAKEILGRLKERPSPQKYLAAILVGNDPASASFIRQKEKVAQELGVRFDLHQLSDSISGKDLELEISEIISREGCGGVIIQLPLPEHINRQSILDIVPKEKDVDVLGKEALETLSKNENPIHPPAVAVVEEILEQRGVELAKMKMAVIGTGLLVGRPISIYFEDKVATLEVFHRSSGPFVERLKEFDIVVSGAGSPHLFSASHLKPGVIVIDFGYGDLQGRMVGDFNPEDAGENIFYTPTPGGTGPILVAKLYQNFYALEAHSTI